MDATLEAEAKDLIDKLAHFASAMSSERQDALADALANEHPTYIGQIAKVVGIGVMRRAIAEPWRPYDRITVQSDGYHPCRNGSGQTVRIADGFTFTMPEHRDHDGRLDCTTVIGAELMARQSFI